jgi:ABC-type multidrug transport system fused ATPase/permease subunit
MSIAAMTSSLVAVSWMSLLSWMQADEDLSNKLQKHAEEIGQTLNENEAVQEVSAGVLQPIYQLAEYISFPAFYWIAFALMAAGVVSFALQLVLGKFFLLFKMSIDFKEILSDLLGLAISLIGLVLTTQAATQNSSFPENPSMVLSATAVGVVVGFVFYWWGQSQEFRAVKQKAIADKND